MQPEHPSRGKLVPDTQSFAQVRLGLTLLVWGALDCLCFRGWGWFVVAPSCFLAVLISHHIFWFVVELNAPCGVSPSLESL